MQIDILQYLEFLESLPYYPYSAIGIGVLILFLIIVLFAKRKRSPGKSKSAYSKKSKGEGPVVRGMPIDGLLSYGEVDLELVENIKNSPMGRVVLPNAPAAPPKPPVDPVLMEAAVKACQDIFQEIYIEMYLGLGLMSDFENMRAELARRIADGKETYHAIDELKMTPDGVVLMQMASVAGNILQSGEQHVGRGLLGIHGQELFSVYRYALNTMQEKGYATLSETQSKLDFMDRKIQELG